MKTTYFVNTSDTGLYLGGKYIGPDEFRVVDASLVQALTPTRKKKPKLSGDEALIEQAQALLNADTKEVIKALSTVKSRELLEAAADLEAKVRKRKTVIKAIQGALMALAAEKVDDE